VEARGRYGYKERQRERERERELLLILLVSDLQRVAIARALLKNAPILILDEVNFRIASLCICMSSPSLNHHDK
jgi:ABC-type branched-subunit amino acid transport system ATPase component